MKKTITFLMAISLIANTAVAGWGGFGVDREAIDKTVNDAHSAALDAADRVKKGTTDVRDAATNATDRAHEATGQAGDAAREATGGWW